MGKPMCKFCVPRGECHGSALSSSGIDPGSENPRDPGEYSVLSPWVWKNPCAQGEYSVLPTWAWKNPWATGEPIFPPQTNGTFINASHTSGETSCARTKSDFIPLSGIFLALSATGGDSAGMCIPINVSVSGNSGCSESIQAKTRHQTGQTPLQRCFGILLFPRRERARSSSPWGKDPLVPLREVTRKPSTPAKSRGATAPLVDVPTGLFAPVEPRGSNAPSTNFPAGISTPDSG